jgi:Zn-dependent protease with chaperone function
MRFNWQGTFFDGKTARRHWVEISLTPAEIKITREDGQVFFWPYEEITQTQGYYKGEQVRIEKGRDPAQALVIPEVEFLRALRKIAPEHSGRFHDPAFRKRRFLWIIIVTFGAVAAAVTVYLWGIPKAAGIAADRVPPEWEARLGQAVAEQFTTEFKQCRAPLAHNSIEKVLKRLDSAAPPHPYTFQIHIVNNGMINAMAAPGGHIIIFTGLLEATESAEELAGVLAHEMVHVLKKHSLKGIFQNLSTYVLLSLIFGDVSVVTDIVHTLGNLRYSRAHEKEADILGIELLIQARVDPSGMVDFFETLKKKTGSSPGALGYVSTHPLTVERIRTLGERKKTVTVAPRPLLPGLLWQEVARACKKGD